LKFNHIEIDIPHPIQINNEGSRYYKTPQGKKYSSITTILSKTFDMSGLNDWINKVGKEVANYIMIEAGKNGTTVHGMCEDYLNDKTAGVRKNLLSQAHFRTLCPFLDRINNIREVLHNN
jgi:hypothetical protein